MIGFAQGAVGGFELIQRGAGSEIIGLHGYYLLSGYASQTLIFGGFCDTIKPPGDACEAGRPPSGYMGW